MYKEVDSDRYESNIEEAINAVIGKIPAMVDKLTSEMEILTGTKTSIRYLTNAKLKTIGRKLIRMSNILTELNNLKTSPVTTESANRFCQLLNRLLRLIVPRISKGVEPIDHVINEIRKLTQIPSYDLPSGLDYRSKHIGLQQFITEIVNSVDYDELSTFLERGFTERHLVSQYQRWWNKAMFPRDLQKYPNKISIRWIERLKVALRDVLTDWESLLSQLYGLFLIQQGEHPTWARIKRVGLLDKVCTIRSDERLARAAKLEWVTIRNSLAHGTAYFNLRERTVEFPDRARTISLNIEQAFTEGLDIFLSNVAMMRIWDFIYLARLSPFEAWIITVKQLAAGTNLGGKG